MTWPPSTRAAGLRRRRPALALLGALALAGCHDFAPIDADGRCGNGVHEPAVGEQCDTVGPDSAACGAPGTAAACQLVCEPVANAACPTGMRCGTDGICRAPSGRFGVPQVLAGAAGQGLQVADVDGDGRHDLVLVGDEETTVAFGDADARFADRRTISITSQAAGVVVGDWDGQAGDDLVFLVGDGVVRVRGGESRRLLPEPDPFAVVSSDAVPTILPIRLPAGALFLAAIRQTGNTLEWARVGEGVGAPEWAPVPGSPTVVAGMANRPPDLSNVSVVTAPGAGAAGEDLHLVTAGGADGAALLSLACAGGPETCQLAGAGRLTLPATQTQSDRGPFVADWDADGRLDVIFAVSVRGEAGLAVALAGPQGLGSVQPLPELAPLLRCPECQGMGAVTLAVADLDGDGRADLVNRNEIVYRTTDAGPPAPKFRPESPWQRVAVVDLNLDGNMDLVGLRLEQTDLVLSAGDGTYFSHRATANGSGGELQVGDFDGDLFPDVAVSEDGERAVVLFGGASGRSDERVEMLELDHITQLVGVQGHAASGELDGLLAVGEGPEGTRALRRLVFLRGDTGRRMRSGVAFARPPAIGAVGRFGDDPSGTVIVGVEQAGEWQFFRIGTRPEAVRDARPLNRSGACDFTGLRALQLRSLSLNPGGPDTLLAWRGLEPDQRDGRMGLPDAWPVWRLSLEGDTLRCVRLGEVGEAAAGLLAPAADDLDGDGWRDAWFAIEPFYDPAGPAQRMEDLQRSGVAVWWGGPDGLTGDPSVWVDAADAENPTGLLAAAEVDGAPGVTLVSWFDEALTPRTFVARDAVTDPFASAARSGGGDAVEASQLVALDANNDGLDDLVQSDGTRLVLSLQLACSAPDVAAGRCPLGAK